MPPFPHTHPHACPDTRTRVQYDSPHLIPVVSTPPGYDKLWYNLFTVGSAEVHSAVNVLVLERVLPSDSPAAPSPSCGDTTTMGLGDEWCVVRAQPPPARCGCFHGPDPAPRVPAAGAGGAAS